MNRAKISCETLGQIDCPTCIAAINRPQSFIKSGELVRFDHGMSEFFVARVRPERHWQAETRTVYNWDTQLATGQITHLSLALLIFNELTSQIEERFVIVEGVYPEPKIIALIHNRLCKKAIPTTQRTKAIETTL